MKLTSASSWQAVPEKERPPSLGVCILSTLKPTRWRWEQVLHLQALAFSIEKISSVYGTAMQKRLEKHDLRELHCRSTQAYSKEWWPEPCNTFPVIRRLSKRKALPGSRRMIGDCDAWRAPSHDRGKHIWKDCLLSRRIHSLPCTTVKSSRNTWVLTFSPKDHVLLAHITPAFDRH